MDFYRLSIMITQEFKKQLRTFLASAFSVKSEVLYSPCSLKEDIYFDESLFMIRAPLYAGGEILDFFIAEGLNVKDMKYGFYSISPVL